MTLWLFLSRNSDRSDSAPLAHTQALSVSCPHVPPFSLSPCDWLFGFVCCVLFVCLFLLSIPKARESSGHCCPTLLQEMLCSRSVARTDYRGVWWTEATLPILLLNQLSLPYRPARMVPSITHGLILASSASSRRKEGASPPPREELQPHGRLCPAVSLPWASQLWALSCVLLRPQKGKGLGGWGGERGGSWGRGGRGGASISNFIINTLFCKVGARFCICTQVSGQSFLCAEGRKRPKPPFPAHFFSLEVPTLRLSQREEGGDCSI